MLFAHYRYLISLSGALALLNVVPCYALDGQYILQASIELLLSGVIPSSDVRGALFTILLLCGTLLVALNILVAMLTLFVL